MEAFFYFMLIVGIFGWVLGRPSMTRKLFYNHDNLVRTQDYAVGIWVAVKYTDTEAEKIKVKVLESPARRLAKDIEIVTKGNIMAESYTGYTYREILESLTKEQLMDIKDLRSFLV